MSKNGGFKKFLAGAALGAGLGLLFSPQSGEKNRKELKKKIDELINQAKEIDIDDVKENVIKKVDEIKKELADLDKEKVASIAKEQASKIQKKAVELAEYAKEKGTPVLESAANSVKDKTIEVLESTLKTLKEEDKKKKTTK